ncbi:MAG: trypsin-like peptidase domain-containing protein [Bdellovibrionota bacterium]|nr:trypsin-like peptidase domain-containing protein [Bdellovibrionota bacterium]
MEKFKVLLLLFMFHFSSYALIFDKDSRLEFFEMPSDIKDLSRSSVALVPKSNLLKLANGDFKIEAPNINQYVDNICDDTKFKDQKVVVNCSGALIKDDVILTAAHCAKKNPEKFEYYIVFDYKNDDLFQTHHIIKKENVFEIEKELFYEFDLLGSIDLALYRLKRKSKRKPMNLNLSPLKVGDMVSILGYPFGIPLKWTDFEPIKEVEQEKYSFKHELDIFSVNSGSPTLNQSNEIVGVLVRGSGFNFKVHEGENCRDWHRSINEKDFSESNDLSPLKKTLDQLGIQYIN